MDSFTAASASGGSHYCPQDKQKARVKAWIAGAAATLAACTTTSGVVAISPDTYVVTSQADLGPNKGASARQAAVDAANQHCGTLGQRAMMESATNEDVGQAGVFQLKGGTTLTFKCIALAS